MTQPDWNKNAPVDTSKMSTVDKILWALTHSAPITRPVVEGISNVPAVARAAGAFEGAQADPTGPARAVGDMSAFERGSAIRSGFSRAVDTPYQLGQAGALLANQYVGKPVSNFVAGLTGGPPDTSPDFASASAFGPPKPEEVAAPGAAPTAPAAQQGQDQFGQLMDMLMGALTTDRSKEIASALGATVPPPVTAGGTKSTPAEPSAAQTELDRMIGEIAKQSSLPEATFKERLGRVLVGIAVGYNSAYAGGRGRPGAAIAAGLTGGAVAGQNYNEQIAADRQTVEEENRRRLATAATLQSGVVNREAEAARAASRDELLREQINMSRQSIIAANTRAAIAANDPMKRITFALTALKAIKEIKDMETQTPYDAVQIVTPTGTMKVGNLPPQEKVYAIAALEAPTKDPVIYAQIRQAVMSKLQDSGELLQLNQYGGDVEKYVQGIVQQNLRVYYKEHPEKLTRREVVNGRVP